MDDLGCRAESESRIKLSATLLGPVWIELSPDRGGSFASRHIFAASLVNGGRSESLCLGSSDVSGEEEVAGEGGRDEIMREYWAGVISETEGSGCIGCGDEQMRGAEGGGRTWLHLWQSWAGGMAPKRRGELQSRLVMSNKQQQQPIHTPGLRPSQLRNTHPSASASPCKTN